MGARHFACALLLSFISTVCMGIDPSYCEYELLECQNNGYFEHCLKQEHAHPVIYTSCVCPEEGWHGVDCTLPDETICDANNTKFDGFPVVAETSQQYQCFLSDDDIDKYHFQDSRVQVDFHLPTVNLTLYSRTRNHSATQPQWMGVYEWMSCHMEGCKAGKYSPDKPDYQLSVTCTDISCRACGKEENCNVATQAIIEALTGEVTFEYSDIRDLPLPSDDDNWESLPRAFHQPGELDDGVLRDDPPGTPADFNGTGAFTLAFRTKVLVLSDISCYTSMCIPEIPDVPTSQWDNLVWISLGVVGLAVLTCIYLGSKALREICFPEKRALLAAINPLSEEEQADLLREEEDETYFVPFDFRAHEEQSMRGLKQAKDRASGDATSLERKQPIKHTGTMYELLFRNVAYHVDQDNGKKCCRSAGSASDRTALPRAAHDVVAASSEPDVQSDKRVILSGISGRLLSGQVAAIMGVSGAGKTTLLDILSCRMQTGYVHGDVLLTRNAQPLFSTNFQDEAVQSLRQAVHHIPVDDHLMETQTVLEALTFTARLRLSHLSVADQDRRIHGLMRRLHLSKIANTRIGMSGSDGLGAGISTGERKRLALAVEMLLEPVVLFMDEPTSGLDSHTAGVLLQTLHRCCRRTKDPMMCVLSIHQPPPHVFNYLDVVLLLNGHGQLVYFGPAADIRDFLQTVPKDLIPSLLRKKIADLPSPNAPYDADADHSADLMLELTATHASLEARSTWYRTSPQFVTLSEYIDDWFSLLTRQPVSRRPSISLNQVNDMIDDNHDEKWGAQMYGESKWSFATEAPWRQQLTLLMHRSFLHSVRHSQLLLLNLLVSLVGGLLMASIFFKLDREIGGAQDRIGFFFFVLFFYSFTALSALPHFFDDKLRFIQEARKSYYGTGVYIGSQIITDYLPMRVFPPMLFASITYYALGLQDDPIRFINFLVVVVLVNMTATSLVFVISILSQNQARASLYSVLVLIFNMLFAGLFLNQDSGSQLSQYSNLAQYVSYFHFAYSALMINEFSDSTFIFNPVGYPSVQVQGSTYLTEFGIDENGYAMDLAAMVIFPICFFLIGFIGLNHLKKQPSLA